MQERAFADAKLEMVWNCEVAAIARRRQARPPSPCATPSPARPGELPVTGLFIAIGHDPRSELLAGPGRPRRRRLRAGRAPLDRAPTSRASSPAGDLVDHHYRQAITAAGTGCAAALDAERYLADLDHAASTAGSAEPDRGRAPRSELA